MATPSFFSGDSARRMETIRRERRQRARVQAARAVTAAATGATEGASAAHAFLAANPSNTYARDRARFFEQLETATPLMREVLQREEQIRRLDFDITKAQLETLGRVAAGKSAADQARMTAEQRTAEQVAEDERNRLTLVATDIEQGSQGTQEALATFYEATGLADEETSTSRRDGRAPTAAEIDLVVGTLEPDLTLMQPGDLQTAVDNGSLVARKEEGSQQVLADGPTMARIGALQGRRNMTLAEAKAFVQTGAANGVREGMSDDELAQELVDASKYTVTVNAENMDRLPTSVQADLNRRALAQIQQDTGAGAGAGTSGQGQRGDLQARRSVNSLNNDEFEDFVARMQDTGASQADIGQAVTQRAQDYEEGVRFLTSVVRNYGNNEGTEFSQLHTTLQRTANALGLDPQTVLNKVREDMGSDWPAELANVRSVEQIKEGANQEIEAYNEAASEGIRKARNAYTRAEYDDGGQLQRLEELESQRTPQATLDDLTNARNTAGAQAAQPAAAQPAAEQPAADLPAPDAAAQAEAEAEQTAQQVQAEQQAADQARQDRGTELFYGFELPAGSIPEDTGGKVLLMWQLAGQYPEYPPLEQAIQDQMNSPEFRSWMQSRGYGDGEPNKQLFREFQREYRVARSMNKVRQRRQIQLNRRAQNRLGTEAAQAMMESSTPSPISDISEEGVFTRQRGREYRQQTRNELVQASPRRLDRERRSAGMLGGMRRQQQPEPPANKQNPRKRPGTGRSAATPLPDGAPVEREE